MATLPVKKGEDTRGAPPHDGLKVPATRFRADGAYWACTASTANWAPELWQTLQLSPSVGSVLETK